MNEPDFNEAIEAEARELASVLDLPLIVVPKIFRVLSAMYFLGFEDGAARVLQSFDKHLEIAQNE